MAGFKPKKNTKAALKLGIYGPPGSGKTFTSLLAMEGLAQITGKRFAFVDTEKGTDFYAADVPARAVHPKAFDFDALETRSITEVLENCRSLNPETHCGVVLDSITHLWEAAQAAYRGKRTQDGGIPVAAWSSIKRPYKELIQWILSTPLHVIICGRQGNAFEEDENGKLKNVGYKMRAEGETAYEPDILIRLEPEKKDGISRLWALAEKDRTGVISGKWIELPSDQRPGHTFEQLIKPLLGLVGGTVHGSMDADADALQDQERLEAQDSARAKFSAEKIEEYEARFKLAKSLDDLDAVAKELTTEIKKQMLTEDVAKLRELFQERDAKLTRDGGTRTKRTAAKATKGETAEQAKLAQDKYERLLELSPAAAKEAWDAFAGEHTEAGYKRLIDELTQRIQKLEANP